MNSNHTIRHQRPRAGFTLVELLFVIVILGILIGMLLPATRQVRGAARRSMCQNNQKQIALACLNYESAFMKFPAMRLTMLYGLPENAGRVDKLSGMVSLVPYLEASPLYDQISNPRTFGGVDYPAWGPALTDENYPPWQNQFPHFLCPSNPTSESVFGVSQYAFSMGDLARELHEPQQLRGAFGGNLRCSSKDIKDGVSNTILIAEMGGSRGRAANSNYAIEQPEAIFDNPALVLELATGQYGEKFAESVTLGAPPRGGHWAAGEPAINGFNTILPPNSPSAQVAGRPDGIFSVGSSHSELVMTAFADGSTHAIPSDIDCGDISAATPSSDADTNETQSPVPTSYGVWGAMGTINGDEAVNFDY
jgi:prepilin-type N-terminal cleavage/methylation domain-containing protein